jgi:predicted RNA-binding protein with PIN domain
MSETPAQDFLIVDGHSVMHAWPELKQHQRVASRRAMARDSLLQRMRTLQDMSGCRVVVVFDGTQSRTTEEREKQGLQVFYADSASTADTVIERLVAKYAKQHSLKVISADGMVRETVTAFGADWASPEGLRELCERAELEMRGWTKNG